MANIEVSFSNFYESVLSTGGLPQSVESCVVENAPTYDGTNLIPTPFYLVVDPDNATAREVIKVTAANGTSFTTVVRDIEGRYGTPEDASSAPNHNADVVIRMAVVGEMFEDVHDRVDVLPTASSTTTFTNKTISDSTNSIDASVIADKSVSNTEFQYLNGVTSNIQTQINSKATIGLVIALGG